ncbi:uncharacterized protein LOC123218353 isoform X3 [Mangifera indica]|uniref:uncharacterized protein LOC123218353 isoform X3 n=1 Tax=Mangifera indica TaxID=29780 RepID=UPI001CFB5539|nr:uncharacterized protein LOC123218353 isoform X3 [Mangifera indica]
MMSSSTSTQPSAPSSSSSSQPSVPSSAQPCAPSSQLSAPSSSQPSAPSSPQPSAPSSQPSAPSSLQPSAPSSQPSSPSSSQPSAPSSSQPSAPSARHLSEQDKKDCKQYLPLYIAILEGNLKYVKTLCDDDRHALEARITANLDTALHVAVGTGTANHIVKYLLNEMSISEVALKNNDGNTVLSVAAIVGNCPAANMILMEEEHRPLTDVTNNLLWIPLIEAARHGQKRMIEFLWQFAQNYLMRVAEPRFEEDGGVLFLNLLIMSGFYDLALRLLKDHEKLATMESSSVESPLTVLARKASAFPSARSRELKSANPSAVPDGRRRKRKCLDVSKLFTAQRYSNETRETKQMHETVLKLVQLLCKEIINNLDFETASSRFEPALLIAAELGVYEVVEEIIKSFPNAIWFTNEKNYSVFHLAVLHRQEKVFNFIFQMSGHKNLLLMSEDTDGNNILHLAGKSAPKHQLSFIPGAALQMQRELQWFKEVEKIVPPKFKEDKNSNKKTPSMIFTEEHENLVKQGEKWMKGAARSCSLVAALIATVVFAASITVPGDYDGNGQPKFFRQIAFTIFCIADALSLFSSIAAIIMCLSILTARYAEDDFHKSLPRRLILGLLMLFLSITSLMIAFGATVYLVFIDKKAYWVLGLVGASACLPVYLFGTSQYPLLRDLIVSTYGSGIFRKQSESILH